MRKRINIFNRPVLWKKREKEIDAERERDVCHSFLGSDRVQGSVTFGVHGYCYWS